MTGITKKAVLAVAMAATALAVSAPADAQRWGGDRDGYRHGGGDVAGAAIIGGILGLGVGAAIADSRRPYYAPGYYGGPYRGYYRPGYYRPGYYDGYYVEEPRCWDQWRWDPYWGRNVRVRVCD